MRRAGADPIYQTIKETVMQELNNPTAEQIKDIVESVDITPEFFVRADGTRMAVMSADFYDQVHAVYVDATVEEVTPDHPIFAQGSKET